jgi:hypothetical protein
MDVTMIGLIQGVGAVVGSLTMGITAGMFVMEATMRGLETAAAHINERRAGAEPFPPSEPESMRHGQRVISLW